MTKTYRLADLGFDPISYTFPDGSIGEHAAHLQHKMVWPYYFYSVSDEIIDEWWRSRFDNQMETELDAVDAVAEIGIITSVSSNLSPKTDQVEVYFDRDDLTDAQMLDITKRTLASIDHDQFEKDVIEAFRYDLTEADVELEYILGVQYDNIDRWVELYAPDDAVNAVVMEAFHKLRDPQPWAWRDYAKRNCKKVLNDAYDFICWAIDNKLDYDQTMATLGIPVRDEIADPYAPSALIPLSSYNEGHSVSSIPTETPETITPNNDNTTMPQTAPVTVPSIVPTTLLTHDPDVQTEYGKWFDAAESAIARYEAAAETTLTRYYSINDAKSVSLYVTELDIHFKFDAKVYNGKMSKKRSAYIYLTNEDGSELRRTFKQSHNATEFIDGILAGGDVATILDEHCTATVSNGSKRASSSTPQATTPQDTTPQDASTLCPVSPSNEGPSVAAIPTEPSPTVQPAAPTISPLQVYECQGAYFAFFKKDGADYGNIYDIETRAKEESSAIDLSQTIADVIAADGHLVVPTDIPSWVIDDIMPKAPNRRAVTKPNTAEIERRKDADRKAADEASAEQSAAASTEQAHADAHADDDYESAMTAEAIAAINAQRIEEIAVHVSAGSPADTIPNPCISPRATDELTFAITTDGAVRIEGLTPIQIEMVRSYIAGMKAALATATAI